MPLPSKTQLGLALLLAVIAFSAGWKLRPVPSPSSQVQQSNSKKIAIIDHVTVTETRPDGTSIVTVKDREETSTAIASSTRTETKPAPLSKYSLGLSVAPKSISNLYSPANYIYGVELGRRISDLPFWATGSIGLRNTGAVEYLSLGIRMEL